LRPSLGIGRMVTAGSRSGARNRVRPSVRLAHSPAGVVRVSSRTRSDSSAFDVHTLRPVTRYPPPSRSALVRMAVVSRPASGSVTPNATCSSPVATRGRYLRLSSSEPCRTTGCMPKIDRWMLLAPFMHAPDAATSSSTIEASVIPPPSPPNSAGMATPIQPPSAMAW
jgi:hypothetical protein